MNEDDRYQIGLKTRREVLGNEWVDRALSNSTELTAEFQEMITRYAWGEIWSRPGLDRKTRSCMVLATTIALGRWDEFRGHLRGGVNNGLGREEIKEVILQSMIYAGVPAANTAMKHAAEVLAEIGC